MGNAITATDCTKHGLSLFQFLQSHCEAQRCGSGLHNSDFLDSLIAQLTAQLAVCYIQYLHEKSSKRQETQEIQQRGLEIMNFCFKKFKNDTQSLNEPKHTSHYDFIALNQFKLDDGSGSSIQSKYTLHQQNICVWLVRTSASPSQFLSSPGTSEAAIMLIHLSD